MGAPLPRVLVVASTLALALAPTRHATADPVVIKQMFNGFVGDAPWDGKTLTSPQSSGGDVVVLQGGQRIGGGTRTTLVFHRMRGSFGFGAFGIRGTRVATNKELDLVSAHAAGGYLELMAGYELRLGPLFPYADLRGTFGFASMSLVTNHPVCGRRAEPVSAHTFFGLGPTLGVFVPVTGMFFVDVSGHAGMLGERDLIGFGGLGLWFPAE